MNNNIRNYLLFFLIGVIVTITPTLLYMNRLPKPLPFHYTPNAIAERKPFYIQVLQTQKEVDNLKKTGVYLSDQATIGAGVRMSTKGIDIYLKQEMEASDVHIKMISPVYKDKVVSNGFTIIPNAVFTSDPGEIQILFTPIEVDEAKNDPKMTYKDDLEIGGGVVCLPSIPCYAIAKSDIADRMVIKPFKSSKPRENSRSTTIDKANTINLE